MPALYEMLNNPVVFFGTIFIAAVAVGVYSVSKRIFTGKVVLPNVLAAVVFQAGSVAAAAAAYGPRAAFFTSLFFAAIWLFDSSSFIYDTPPEVDPNYRTAIERR